MMDSDLKYKGWNDTQQSTGYQKRNRGKRGLHRESAMLNRDKLGLQSLSGGFFWSYQNQNLTGRPNAIQSQYDSTINLRVRKAKHSTINPHKEKVKDSLIASTKNKIIVKIVVPKFLATVQTKHNLKNDSLIIVLGLS